MILQELLCHTRYILVHVNWYRMIQFCNSTNRDGIGKFMITSVYIHVDCHNILFVLMAILPLKKHDTSQTNCNF